MTNEPDFKIDKNAVTSLFIMSSAYFRRPALTKNEPKRSQFQLGARASRPHINKSDRDGRVPILRDLGVKTDRIICLTGIEKLGIFRKNQILSGIERSNLWQGLYGLPH